MSPSEARLGATELVFLGHSTSPAGLHPDTNEVRAVTDLPIPPNVSQLRSLLGGLSYYRNFLPNLCKQTRPITNSLGKNTPCAFSKDAEVVVCDLLETLTGKPVLCFPDWDAVQDSSRHFLMRTDVITDGFGVVPNQPQLDGSARPILCSSRATLPNEANWSNSS